MWTKKKNKTCVVHIKNSSRKSSSSLWNEQLPLLFTLGNFTERMHFHHSKCLTLNWKLIQILIEARNIYATYFFYPSLPTSSGVKIHNCVISSLYNRSQDSYQVEYGLVEIKIGITEPFANDNHDGSTMFVHSSYVNAVRSFLNITTKS